MWKLVISLLFGTSLLLPTTGQALDCVRKATEADKKVLGDAVVVGVTCIDGATDQALKPQESAQAFSFLESRVCDGQGGTPTMKAGFPSGANASSRSTLMWGNIKNRYVYFSAGSTTMDPGAARCFADFFKAAENAGFKPCVTAGLRAPAHQMTSCLDTRNTVVCGRSNRGTGSASSCSQDPAAYNGCPHVNGLAIDINDKSGRLYELLDFARKSGKFSKVGAGAADPWHIEARGCATGNSPYAGGPPGGTSAPGNGIVGNALRNLFGGQQDQCQQLSTQCTSGNSSACMQYAQGCSQAPAAAPPSAPTGGSGSSGTTAQGTQGIAGAYQPATTPPSAVTPPSTATSSNESATTSTSTPITILDPLEQILISTDLSTASTTTATTTNPLSSTTITYLSQERTNINEINSRPISVIQKEEPFIIPSTPIETTFSEENPFPKQSDGLTREQRSTFGALLSEARTILEGLLAYVQPFSVERYSDVDWLEGYDAGIQFGE